MGVARIPVGQALDALGLLNIHRGVSTRLYTSPVGLTQPNTSANSFVDDGTINGTQVSPKLYFGAGSTVAGPNQFAEVVEHFNQDPFVSSLEPGPNVVRGDVYWGLPICVGGYFMPATSFSLAAGCYFGISIGGLPGSGILGVLGSQISLHLRYDMFLDHWHAVVANKWAAVGHKVFDIDLGTSAALGVFKPFVSCGNHLEIIYMPNQYVDFFIDSVNVLRFTDETHGNLLGALDTPLKDIYNNRAAAGATIKGMSAYFTTGPSGASQNHIGYVSDLRSIMIQLA